jgi:hypothetical protein
VECGMRGARRIERLRGDERTGVRVLRHAAVHAGGCRICHGSGSVSDDGRHDHRMRVREVLGVPAAALLDVSHHATHAAIRRDDTRHALTRADAHEPSKSAGSVCRALRCSWLRVVAACRVRVVERRGAVLQLCTQTETPTHDALALRPQEWRNDEATSARGEGRRCGAVRHVASCRLERGGVVSSGGSAAALALGVRLQSRNSTTVCTATLRASE